MNAHQPPASVRLYFLIWGALMFLLFATWGVAQFDLGKFNIVAAMTIAIVKMLMVILVFMHLRYSSRITWIFAAAGFFWLLIMFTLTMGDYTTRAGFNPR